MGDLCGLNCVVRTKQWRRGQCSSGNEPWHAHIVLVRAWDSTSALATRRLRSRFHESMKAAESKKDFPRLLFSYLIDFPFLQRRIRSTALPSYRAAKVFARKTRGDD